jgi:serine phosphatase RsbU (regulator of sigma subunit)
MQEEAILVVDDEIANLQKLRRTLINRFPVLAASSGKEALDLIQKNREKIAVIIVDQRMPDMTGIDLLRETLELLPYSARIILTGYTDIDVLMDAINSCKVHRYIVKPWDPPDLLITVERGVEAYRLAKENAQFKKELIRRERLARELEIARDIQNYILPPRHPLIEGFEIGVEYHPAREVGGDLYDFDLGEKVFQIVIGDVSGKSIPAALYGAVFSGHLQTIFSNDLAPADALGILNNNLVARYQTNNYIAVAYCRLDTANGSGVLANAGMPFPFLIQGNEVIRLEIPGLPLGLMNGVNHGELQFQMDPGDVLVLISDGILDAANKEDVFYDTDRFIQSIRNNINEPINLFLKNLYSDLRQFTRDAELSDDVTIVALRRK